MYICDVCAYLYDLEAILKMAATFEVCRFRSMPFQDTLSLLEILSKVHAFSHNRVLCEKRHELWTESPTGITYPEMAST